MTEQDKLRKALEAAQEGLRYGSEFGAEAISILVPHLKRLVDAAEQSLTFRRLPLPEELDEKTLEAMWCNASGSNFGGQLKGISRMRAAYKALYEHLTKPKTKIVNVIEGSGRSSPPCTGSYETDNENVMHNYIDRLRADGFGLIKITTKEVPL